MSKGPNIFYNHTPIENAKLTKKVDDAVAFLDSIITFDGMYDEKTNKADFVLKVLDRVKDEQTTTKPFEWAATVYGAVHRDNVVRKNRALTHMLKHYPTVLSLGNEEEKVKAYNRFSSILENARLIPAGTIKDIKAVREELKADPDVKAAINLESASRHRARARGRGRGNKVELTPK
jgi:hypothetical protein